MAVGPRARLLAPNVLGTSGRPVALARDVRAPPPPARLARLRESRRSTGVCDLARRTASNRGRVPESRLRLATPARGPSFSLGRRPTRRLTGRVRLRELGTATGRHASRRPIGMGCRRPGRQRMGMDVHRVSPVSWFRRQPVISRVLGRLLRRIALRDEGRFSSNRTRAPSSDVPQLVPAALSLRLRHASVACGRSA